MLRAVFLCVSHQFGGKYMFPRSSVAMYAVNGGLRLCSPPVHAESLFLSIIGLCSFQLFHCGTGAVIFPTFRWLIFPVVWGLCIAAIICTVSCGC